MKPWILVLNVLLFVEGLAAVARAEPLPKLVEWTFATDAGPFPVTSSKDMVLEASGGIYRMSNRSGSVLTVQLSPPYDREKPYAFEAVMRASKETTGRLLAHFTADDAYSIGMLLDGKSARPSKQLGKNSHANADAYAASVPVGNDFVTLRIECRPDKGEYSSGFDRLQITYLVNGKVVGVDDNGFFFKESGFGLQVWGPGTIEVKSYAFFGTEKATEEVNVMQVAASFTAAETAPQKAFQIGDPMYAVVKFAKPMSDLFQRGVTARIRETVRLGDQELGAYEYDMDDADRDAQGTRYEVAFCPVDQVTPRFPGQATALMKALLAVPSGTQSVKLSVTGKLRGSSEVIGLGAVEIELDGSNAAGRKLLESKMLVAQNAFLAKVKFPQTLKKDAALEKGVRAAIRAAKWKQEILKVAIVQSDWGALTHETFGTVLQRMINTAVGVKMQDGSCMIFYPTVFQKHLGGGKFSSETTLGGNHKIEQAIACSNLK